ncbi:MAG: Asp-tRNA(Asn)/Glu-tRNA(Gln) amidotransferase subunit GatA, partial [Candidatus Heimdallarchaeota archaeon]|nr:Asp-tRNA(Asn)/Glu-tRNA(Gln) amidotransferase subunit GatA [Candidatus Heimdallarchaeota archaeon]
MIDKKLTTLDIHAMNNGLKSRQFSVEELVISHIAQIKEYNTELNAFVFNAFDSAIEYAKKIDNNFNIQNYENNQLYGIPFGVKDNFCTKGILTTACSKMLANFIPEYTATVVDNLYGANSVLLGKLNMNEFAMGSSNSNSSFGPAFNWYRKSDKTKVVPGGSSGGSAAAVAAYMCPFSLGSDTGGSVRQPASFCGVVGVKPTYGKCSRYGMIPLANSLDQAGIFTRNMRDAALVLNTICSKDDKDSTSLQDDKYYRKIELKPEIKGKKIGIPKEYLELSMHEDIKESWLKYIKLLEENGAEIVEISMPNIDSALYIYYIIMCSEAYSNLSRYDGVKYGAKYEEARDIKELYMKTRNINFGYEVKKRILMGAYVLSSDNCEAVYNKALLIRKLIANDYQKAFNSVDVILTPTTSNLPFSLAEKPSDLEMYANDIFTVSINLAQLPGVSLPVDLSKKDKLPIGLQ